MARTGKSARQIFSTDIFADTSKSKSAPKSAGKPAGAIGRPTVHEEEWERVTVVLFKRQVVGLDRLGLDIRAHTGHPISRAEIIRALVDALLLSKMNIGNIASTDDLRARLAAKLAK